MVSTNLSIFFQLTLHADGTIVFVYVFVPDLLTTDALYDNEPVAGLSDAFLIGDSELHVYHTLNVDNPDIKTGTVIVFNAKPTCIRQTSCDACMNLRETSEFSCSYCPAVHRQVPNYITTFNTRSSSNYIFCSQQKKRTIGFFKKIQ